MTYKAEKILLHHIACQDIVLIDIDIRCRRLIIRHIVKSVVEELLCEGE